MEIARRRLSADGSHQTDRGWQNCAHDYLQLLRQHGFKPRRTYQPFKVRDFVATAVGMGLTAAICFMAQLPIIPPSAFALKWASIAIFVVMVSGVDTIDGILIGAAINFVADRYFGKYGALFWLALAC